MSKDYEKKDDAVSPVVGVMLMLVVTIIIAAVVSGFAGGLANSQEKAPQASIAVSTGYIDGQFDIKFEHQGGDPIRTKDCELITFLTLPNGTVIKHVQTPTSPLARGTRGGNGAADWYTYSRGPHLTDPQKYAYPCSPATNKSLPSGWTLVGYENATNYAWFGEAVWLPGDIARTYHNGFTAVILGILPADKIPGDGDHDNADYDAAIATLEDCVQKNSKLEIKLLHVPSEKYILDKTITLQG